MKRSIKKLGLISLLTIFVTLNGACAQKGKAMDAIKGKNGIFALMDTDKGQIMLELYYKDTPLTVINFAGLAQGTLDVTTGVPFYDGLKFHRVIKDFMIQGGDPRGNGTGGPGYKFTDEIVDKYKFNGPGVLAMANAGANTNGSQFFITHKETPWLNGHHTIFGQVIAGQDVVNAIAQGDTIKSVTIIKQGTEAESFATTQAEWDKYSNLAVEKLLKEKEKAQKSVIAEIEKRFPGYKKSIEGIYYKTTKEGTGEKTGGGKNVSVHYKGYFIDGKVFDESSGRGPLDFKTASGMMIKGFDIMVQDMKKGEVRTVVLPPDQAYGEAGIPGAIPENSYLAFDITLLKN